MTISKRELRKEARERRALLAAAQPDFALRLAAVAQALALTPGTILGGYHALPHEADPALLLERLIASGCHIAFPRVAAKGLPLAFHRVPDGEALRAGAYGIAEPADHFPSAIPDLLLVPLLAFDRHGHRLGYGGGFYDRTLQTLRIPAIGVAYAGQEVSSIPAEAHDRRLDGILTEQGLRRFL
jgi:5-formyltetrahydrofolate cyclo-ligase